MYDVRRHVFIKFNILLPFTNRVVFDFFSFLGYSYLNFTGLLGLLCMEKVGQHIRSQKMQAHKFVRLCYFDKEEV